MDLAVGYDCTNNTRDQASEVLFPDVFELTPDLDTRAQCEQCFRQFNNP
jgi:hypothetical protein